MNTISQQIDDFIAANGGNARDALNIALARLEQAELRTRQIEEDKFISNEAYMNPNSTGYAAIEKQLYNKAYNHNFHQIRQMEADVLSPKYKEYKEPYIKNLMDEKQEILANYKRTKKDNQRLKELDEILSPCSKKQCEDIATDILNKAFEIINKKMINKDKLIELGCTLDHNAKIMEVYTYNLGRGRHLEFCNIGTPNEFIYICETDPIEEDKITDAICLHNFDYDDYLTEERAKELIKVLTFKPKKKDK